MKLFKLQTSIMILFMFLLLPAAIYLLFKNYLIIGIILLFCFLIILFIWRRGFKERMIIYEIYRCSNFEESYQVLLNKHGLNSKTIIDRLVKNNVLEKTDGNVRLSKDFRP